ncbi:ATP-binding cassette subfamily B protein [Thermonema lapsum]|uniref:ATP-binding cassette subfamily B protein n=1 Tax=Thermonema lapsum TaxID=28195 RepID=A0A846MSQ1_9BACT|nr:peptidase domain-containing ABC transporter [Thermonema lapsum]NIK74626.1 ATP-binding cassette subfamily B protein [Thermonema lapsum]
MPRHIKQWAKRVPFVPQLESADCGPACLAMIARYHGIKVHVKQLRALGKLSRLGVSVAQLLHLAQQIGLEAKAYKASPGELEQLPLPCILFWKQDHYVVLERISRKKQDAKRRFTLLDPAYGRVQLTEEAFLNEWLAGQPKGILIYLQPASMASPLDLPPVQNEGMRHVLREITSFLARRKGAYVGGLLLIIGGMAANWYTPKLFQEVIDEGIMQRDIGMVLALLLAQMALFFGSFISESWSTVVFTRLNLGLSLHLQEHMFRYLTRLPLAYFDARINTETLQRLGDLSEVRRFVAWQLMSLLLHLSNILIFGFLLYRLSALVFWIYVGFTLLSVGWVMLFLRHRRALNYANALLKSKLNHLLYEFVTKMQELRIYRAQDRRLDKIMHLSEEQNRQEWRDLWLNLYQNAGTTLFGKLKDVAVVAVCAYLIILKQELSLGVLMSASFIIGQLSAPVNAWLFSVDELQSFRIAQERLGLVFEQAPEQPPGRKKPLPESIQTLTIRGLSFYYPGYEHRLILDDIHLEIRRGEKVAIVGSTGSGKTTLMRLLLGYYFPVKGDILLNGQPLWHYDIDAWRTRCGVVLQDGSILSGTVAENVAPGVEQPDMQRIEEVCRLVCLHDDIMKLPMRYQTKLGGVGMQLSGGQQQRLLIARALYHQPDILFLDEATSALDAATERAIVKNLSAYLQHRTAFIIAHRLSTVRNADRIIVLENGRIVETGSHEELLYRQGLYYHLISNQLALGS